MPDFREDVIVRDANGIQRMLFKANTAELWMWDRNGQRSLILGSVTTVNDTCKLHMGKIGVPGDITLSSGDDDTDRIALELSGKDAFLSVGSPGNPGQIVINDSGGKRVFHFKEAPNVAHLIIGNVEASQGQAKHGLLSIRDRSGADTLQLNGAIGEIGIFRNGGRIFLKGDGGKTAFLLDESSRSMALFANDAQGTDMVTMSGATGNMRLKGGIFLEKGGKIHVQNGGSIEVDDSNKRRTFFLDGPNAHLVIGAKENGRSGHIFVKDNNGKDAVFIDGQNAHVSVGTAGNEGDITVNDSAGKPVFFVDGQHAHLSIGAEGNAGDITVNDSAGKRRVHLVGESGDIALQGGDCAEEFDVEDCKDLEPGVVLTLNEDGYQDSVSISDTAYDRKVVGVYSGAGSYKPGLILDRKPITEKRRIPVAMMGKVYCKVDASWSPIKRGDLLVSSDTPGHAMKATDPVRSVGSILGKALKSFDKGKGLVPILAMLQ